jgi:hypothetical protein
VGHGGADEGGPRFDLEGSGCLADGLRRMSWDAQRLPSHC